MDGYGIATGLTGVVLGIALGILIMLTYGKTLTVEPGVLNNWECSDSMTMIVDVPNDGQSPVEGYHCERVKKTG